MSCTKKRKACFNPFNKPASHSKEISDLRRICDEDLQKLEGADENCLFCSTCRKEIKNYTPKHEQNESHSQNLESQTISVTSSPASSSQGSLIGYDDGHTIDVLLGISPVKRKFCDKDSYTTSKFDEIQEGVRKKFKADFNVLQLKLMKLFMILVN